MIRKGLILFSTLLLAACGGGGGGGGAGNDPITGAADCSLAAQKQFVLDRMRSRYLWSDLLPADVRIEDFGTPEELLDFLTTFSPNGVDRFSYIDTASADSAFFGEGQFLGFGFRYGFVDTDSDGLVDEVPIVLVYEQSPAGVLGLERGQRIQSVDGRTIPEIAQAGALDTLFAPDIVQLQIRRLDGSLFDVVIEKDTVTIDPVPQARVISTAGGPVGYLEFLQFIGTAEGAEGPLEQAFAEFRDAGVADIVIDLRYNGGGFVRVAELLGDYLGGFIAAGQVFSRTLYNDQNSASNRVEEFERLTSSINLSRLVIIATRNTASASELVINSMFPYADVTIVGNRTFGKPVGQSAETLTECDFILRPVAFETVNALNEGGYFGGLPVDCPAPDDLDIPIGDDQDPMLRGALALLANGACPEPAVRIEKPVAVSAPIYSEPGPIWRSMVSEF